MSDASVCQHTTNTNFNGVLYFSSLFKAMNKTWACTFSRPGLDSSTILEWPWKDTSAVSIWYLLSIMHLSLSLLTTSQFADLQAMPNGGWAACPRFKPTCSHLVVSSSNFHGTLRSNQWVESHWFLLENLFEAENQSGIITPEESINPIYHLNQKCFPYEVTSMPGFPWYFLNIKILRFSEFNTTSDCLTHPRAKNTNVTSMRQSNQQVPLHMKTLLQGIEHDLYCSSPTQLHVRFQ